MQKGVFCCFVFLLLFGGFVFLCVFIFLFEKNQKGYFPAILEYVFFFCVPKKPVFKILVFFLFCFIFWFSFCLPFQNYIFIFALSINPFLENINIFGFFIFLFLAFPFLNVCLFLSNKIS